MNIMKFEICTINKNTLKHLYINEQGRMWFSSTKATVFTHEEASKLIHDIRIKQLNPFIQAEYECHFREVDEWNFKINNLYSCYEPDFTGTYTESEMENLYDNIVDHIEYPTYEGWKHDMLKTGIFYKGGKGK